MSDTGNKIYITTIFLYFLAQNFHVVRALGGNIAVHCILLIYFANVVFFLKCTTNKIDKDIDIV